MSLVIFFVFVFFAVRFLEIENMLLAHFANSRSIAYSVAVAAAAATHNCACNRKYIYTQAWVCVCVRLYLFFARKHFRHFKCSERSDQTG